MVNTENNIILELFLALIATVRIFLFGLLSISEWSDKKRIVNMEYEFRSLKKLFYRRLS